MQDPEVDEKEMDWPKEIAQSMHGNSIFGTRVMLDPFVVCAVYLVFRLVFVGNIVEKEVCPSGGRQERQQGKLDFDGTGIER